MDRINATLAAPLLFLLLAGILVWPLPLHLDSLLLTDQFDAIPQYADTERHIQYMEESATLLRDGRSPFIVEPNYALAQTYLLGGGIAVAAGMPPVTAHNLWFLLSMALSGLFTYWLFRHLERDVGAAVLAGVLYMSSFYLVNEYVWGHPNLWQIQWIPLIVLALERLRGDPSPRNTLLLGVSFSLLVLSSAQYAVYSSALIPIYLLLQHAATPDAGVRDRRFLQRFAAAGGIAAVIAAPYLLQRMQQLGETVTWTIADNLNPAYVLNGLDGLFFAYRSDLQLILRLTLLLGAAGVIAVAGRDRCRDLTPWAGIYVLSLLLAIGPVSLLTPYYWLHAAWPFVDYFRVPYRVYPFAALSYSMVVGAALSRLRQQAPAAVEQRAIPFLLTLVILLQIWVFRTAHGFHVVAAP